MNTRNKLYTKSRSTGFTLVELLVVIAIISVLAGMLLPALEGAIDSARKISCLSNMKQIYMNMTYYSNDNNDFLPGNTNSNEPNRIKFSWNDGTSGSYVRRNAYVDEADWKSQAQVFFCPSAHFGSNWKDLKVYAYDGGCSTYFYLNNYPYISSNPTLRWTTGGRMSRFNPMAGLVQDAMLNPTSATTNPSEYINNHDWGGNIILVQGAGGWEDESQFLCLSGYYLGKEQVSGLNMATSYIFHTPAIDNGN